MDNAVAVCLELVIRMPATDRIWIPAEGDAPRSTNYDTPQDKFFYDGVTRVRDNVTWTFDAHFNAHVIPIGTTVGWTVLPALSSAKGATVPAILGGLTSVADRNC